jgi:polysaccharide export outer membrane protein
MMAMNFASLLLALMLSPQVGTTSAPKTPNASETPTPAPLAEPFASTQPRAAAPERYVIGPQDQLKVTVFDEPDLSGSYRVDDGGAITFPLLGRIMAGGQTLSAFQDQLRAQLASGYIRNPQVRVDIDQFKSQSVMVVGEVRSAGKIPMTGASMTLLEALVAAGSPTAQASNEIVVRHKPLEPGQEGEEIRVNRKDLELGKKDVALRDGDIINVPTAQRFYMDGFVRNPGYYVLDPGMTVQQAIALAGGLTDRGANGRITAKRLINGKTQEIRLKLEDKVQPNDTINVPSKFF